MEQNFLSGEEIEKLLGLIQVMPKHEAAGEVWRLVEEGLVTEAQRDYMLSKIAGWEEIEVEKERGGKTRSTRERGIE